MMNDQTKIFDWTLRFIESMAFYIHGILGLTEPFTSCLRRAFGDKYGALPIWFWPVAGLILWIIATLNLMFGDNDAVILTVQSYIASFHSGAVFYHLYLGHHPATGVAPGVFVVFAFIIASMRLDSVIGGFFSSFLVAFIGTAVCVVIAKLLSLVLLKPRSTVEEQELIAENSSAVARAEHYLGVSNHQQS